MRASKRILLISDLKLGSPRSAFVEARRIVKGLIRTGHDVLTFSFMNAIMENSPFPSKRFARHLGKARATEKLLDMARYYYPDAVFFLGLKDFGVEAVTALREAAPGAVFLACDGDPFPEKYPGHIEIAKKMDIIVMPSAGRFLEVYKMAGVSCCAFIPFTVDPDTHYRYGADDRFACDIIFTGKAEHRRLERENDRYEIATRLAKMANAKLFGCLGQPPTNGIDCFRALSNAKVGVSINIANDVYLYHSDRYTNIPACGTFALAKRAPGYDLLFKDGKEMVYFDSADEFFELAQYYLDHEGEREEIAKAGMERAHSEFNFERVAGFLVDLVDTGTYDAEWRTVL